MIHKKILTAALAISFAFTSFAQNTIEQSQKNKNKACSDKFKIDETNIVITNDKSYLSGYFTLQFEKGSDMPTTMKVVMEISDCKGNISFISIPMSMDVKTGLWIGKGGIAQLPGCNYSEGNMTLIISNECGELFSAEDENDYKSRSRYSGPEFRKVRRVAFEGSSLPW